MARRKYAMYTTNDKRAVCYYDSDLNEHSVAFFRGSEKLVDADYFTNDRIDALKTAEHFVNFE